jgi:LPPG:FO 2-phospho-L-lactate transferase
MLKDEGCPSASSPYLTPTNYILSEGFIENGLSGSVINPNSYSSLSIVAFAGGVGGAKLADGLARCLPPENLTVVVNTGDDFEHWGLKICPDLDTVCYTLAGLANPETGWGRIDETFNTLENISRLGDADWFRIGDKDLATHIERTRRLHEGQSLSEITRDFCRAWGIGPTVLPMTDDPVATIVDTIEQGELSFQEYFVHQRCAPQVKGFRFDGVSSAQPAPGVLDAIRKADAVVFCPSNPWVSIDPILAVLTLTPSPLPMREGQGVRVVAVSPIIGGQTVKGPAAKMFTELGLEPSALAVAKHYGESLSGFVLDTLDVALADEVQKLGIQPLVVPTIMKTARDREQLAQDVLHFVMRIIA